MLLQVRLSLIEAGSRKHNEVRKEGFKIIYSYKHQSDSGPSLLVVIRLHFVVSICAKSSLSAMATRSLDKIQ